ncbi:MAG: DUF1365 domain-containing protein [Pirellulales bacterium]
MRHRRALAPAHEFTAGVRLLYLDLAELPGPLAGRWVWGCERGAVSWRRADHFGDPRVAMADAVRDLVEERTGFRPHGPIRVLTLPRMWGYYFNPLAVFYCFDPTGTDVEAVVAEVSNTPWGERHCYVLRHENDAGDNVERSRVLRAEFAKRMHVSPFLPMDLTYRWTGTTPGKRLAIRLQNHRATDDGPDQVFDAVMNLERREITTGTLAGVLLAAPWQTGQVWAAIYWQALRLWWKNARFFPHPGPVREFDNVTQVR